MQEWNTFINLINLFSTNEKEIAQDLKTFKKLSNLIHTVELVLKLNFSFKFRFKNCTLKLCLLAMKNENHFLKVMNPKKDNVAKNSW